MKKRFGDLKKMAIFAAGHLKRPVILATSTVQTHTHTQTEIDTHPQYSIGSNKKCGTLFLNDCHKTDYGFEILEGTVKQREKKYKINKTIPSTKAVIL